MTKVGEHITLDIIGITKEYDESLFEKVIRLMKHHYEGDLNKTM